MPDTSFINHLVCPLTKTQLIYSEDHQELISQVSGLAYPIRNGIPILLIDEARIIDANQTKLFAPELIPHV